MERRPQPAGPRLRKAAGLPAQTAAQRWPRQCNAIRTCLDRLAQLEAEGSEDLDAVSGCFGELMAELFDYKQDHWSPELRGIGFHLANSSTCWTPTMTWHGTRKRAHTIRCAPSAVSPATRKRCGKFLSCCWPVRQKLRASALRGGRGPSAEHPVFRRVAQIQLQAGQGGPKKVTNSAQKADFVLILQALSCRL